jgi:hypothetical protein
MQLVVLLRYPVDIKSIHLRHLGRLLYIRLVMLNISSSLEVAVVVDVPVVVVGLVVCRLVQVLFSPVHTQSLWELAAVAAASAAATVQTGLLLHWVH